MGKKTNTELALSPKKTQKAAITEVDNAKVKTPEQVAKGISKELKKFELGPNETFEIVDPITKEKKTVSLSRTGTQETDLIVALSDPNVSRARKDHALSMYLFGRGAESASFIVDIMRSKGEHTKETRVFKSQMRFDFEGLVEMEANHLREQAERTAAILDIDLQKEIAGYMEWLKLPNNSGKDYTYWDFLVGTDDRRSFTRANAAIISQAIFDLAQSKLLIERRTKIMKAREEEKGGGIYVDRNGRAYRFDDPEVDEAIKADREATADIEHE